MSGMCVWESEAKGILVLEIEEWPNSIGFLILLFNFSFLKICRQQLVPVQVFLSALISLNLVLFFSLELGYVKLGLNVLL